VAEKIPGTVKSQDKRLHITNSIQRTAWNQEFTQIRRAFEIGTFENKKTNEGLFLISTKANSRMHTLHNDVF